jgi:hypothetical protein
MRSKGIYSPERIKTMNNTVDTTKNEPVKAQEAPQHDFEKRIGKTTYKVNVHFSTTSKETITDKIFRLLRNEVSQSPNP